MPIARLDAQGAAWETSDVYPKALQEIVRWKVLVGSSDVPCPDAAMGILELHPGVYPFHAHPAPEIYYVFRGRAEWTVDSETFEAREGTGIYHPPGAKHKMVNRGKSSLLAVWFWWAPDGRTQVLQVPPRLTED